MKISSSSAPGSGGLVVTSRMRTILEQPGYLGATNGGEALRRLYCDQTNAFNPMLLSPFGLDCFTGDLQAVTQAVKNGSVPDLAGTETDFKFGYATLVVSGAQRITHAPVPCQHLETMAFLLSHGCPPDVEDIVGITALGHAVMHMAISRQDLVRLLLEGGANVNHRDRYGAPPIMNAFQTNNVASIDILMEFGADLEIADADGIVPRTMFVSCGPQVAAMVSKWLRKRSGEDAPMDENVCQKCRSPGKGLKLCSKCKSAKYCSVDCQRSHWPEHKKVCQPFSTSNTITLKPNYNNHSATVPIANLIRHTMDIPTEPTPERHFRGSRAPKSLGSKTLIIKVQIPYAVPDVPSTGLGDLFVYTKKRDFVCHITQKDNPAGYNRISRIIKTQGVGGAKAYFAAELKSKEELIVKVSEVLAVQPW